jgi:NAD(P)-dependent dehydrogenase (short-subunit alcohol dehydrogenase family)
MESGKLDGKIALVVGASSGIGEATALALAGERAHPGDRCAPYRSAERWPRAFARPEVRRWPLR